MREEFLNKQSKTKLVNSSVFISCVFIVEKKFFQIFKVISVSQSVKQPAINQRLEHRPLKRKKEENKKLCQLE